VLISQRPSRLDETTLAQCNSFLVLRLVNPRDKNFVRSVMENLSESDAGILQTFGPGQGIVSGQAVRFPLLVKVKFDSDLVSEAIGDEDFIAEASAWTLDPRRTANAVTVKRHVSPRPMPPQGNDDADGKINEPPKRRPKPLGRRGRIQPEGF
jgi:hypothetical protein